MRMLFPALLSALIFTHCKNNSGTTGDDLSLIPFKEFKFDSAEIKPGTPVSILAFTGSRQPEKNTAYYPQFIVVNQTTGDTLKILTTLISVDDDALGNSKSAYSPPSAFNGNAQVLDAIFEARPEQEDMFLDLVSDGTIKSPGDAAAGKAASRQEFVVVDKTTPIFMRPYKTAIGVLRFHRRPW